MEEVIPTSYKNFIDEIKPEPNSTLSKEDDQSPMQHPSKNIASQAVNWLIKPAIPINKNTGPPSLLDIFRIFVSMTSRVFDQGSDIILAIDYCLEGQIGHFLITLLFVLVPAIVLVLIVLTGDFFKNNGDDVCNTKRIVTILLVMFQLEIVRRGINAFRIGLKSRHAFKNNKGSARVSELNTLMWREVQATTYLRTLETFMEAAPQVTFQLYIQVNNFILKKRDQTTGNFYLQILSIATSLISLAWALSTANKIQRCVSHLATFFYFHWQLFTYTARLFAYACVASIYPYPSICSYVFDSMCVIFSLREWVKFDGDRNFIFDKEFMDYFSRAIWYKMFVNFSDKYCNSSVVASVSKTCTNLALNFYMFLENCTLLAIWFFCPDWSAATPETVTLRNNAIYTDLVLLFTGLAFMIVYQTCFHSKRTNEENTDIV